MDGRLYAGLAQNTTTGSGGDIHTLDLTTGAATFLGSSGLGSITGLTLVADPVVPEPGSLAVFGIGALMCVIPRRRRLA